MPKPLMEAMAPATRAVTTMSDSNTTRYQRTADLFDGDPKLTGTLAVDVHLHHRTVEHLSVLQIAQPADPGQLRPTVSAYSRLTVRFAPVTATSIGVGEPKLITWSTRSAASKDDGARGYRIDAVPKPAAPAGARW
jgi:hypothetical protein